MKYFILILFYMINVFAQTNQDISKKIELGKGLYFAKGCYGCHGPTAMGDGSYPQLATLDVDFVFKRLNYFKNGRMKTSKSYMMAPFAKGLSKEDMKNLGYYFNSLSEVQPKREEIEEDPTDAYGGGGS